MRLRAILFSVTMGVTAVLGTTAAAVAAPAAGAGVIRYHARDVATGRCLDSNKAGSAYTLPCQAANTYQMWERPGGMMLVDTQTRRCLDSNKAGKAYTSSCRAGNRYQYWEHPSGRMLVNTQTRRCLDSNKYGNLYTSSCKKGNLYQWWTLTH